MRALFAFFLIWPVSTLTAEPASPKEKAEAFLASVQKGDISGGYDRLFMGSAIPQDKPQAITLVKTQTQSGLPLYGKILGYDFIKEEKHGSSVVRLVYLLKSEKAPTIWEFHFYKPTDAWFLASVIFNDQFALLR